MTDNTTGYDQQLVYRIDCNKHYTVGGAPPILVLQKDSSKPPIIILEGVKTYPSEAPIIRDERRDKSQGYIFQDERKPPPDSTQVNPTTLPHLPSNYGGESLYSYQQPNNQHLYDQEYPMNQSSDHSSFGNYPSDLSYHNNTTVSLSPWIHREQYQYRRPYDIDNYDKGFYSAMPTENGTNRANNDMYGDGYTQNEPYHWQPSLYQHNSWTTPELMPTQNQSYLSPFFENNNGFGGYNNDMMHGRERVGMTMTPRQANCDSIYNSPSLPWPTYNNNIENSTMMMPVQEGTTSYPWNHYEHTTPPLRRNPALPVDMRQPAFRVVNGPRRSKSVSFAPLPDHVAT